MSKFSPVNAKFSNDDKMLEAGEYVVIDPCYVIGGDPFWGELVEFSFPDDETYRKSFFIEVDGYKIFAFSTAHGDGSYPVQDGKNCGDAGVDAGMLSLIPLEYLKKNNISEDDLCLGVKVTLDFDRYPEYDGGNVTCGNINITTNYEDDGTDEDDETDEDNVWYCNDGTDKDDETEGE